MSPIEALLGLLGLQVMGAVGFAVMVWLTVLERLTDAVCELLWGEL